MRRKKGVLPAYNISMIRMKRIYDEPAANDGARVLVDRLWPRGVSKQRAAVDLWLKEVAPSPDLRVWFDHRPERFKEFSLKYTEELSGSTAAGRLLELANKGPLTLLYAAKDPAINHAVVLRAFLQEHHPQ